MRLIKSVLLILKCFYSVYETDDRRRFKSQAVERFVIQYRFLT